MTTIGFVGLGSMGAPLAGRLPGNTVYGTNRTRAKASALIGQGLIWQDTPRAVAAAAQVVFSMVTDDAAPLLRRLGSSITALGGTAKACCSSWRSTSASPRRCLPSARGCCWPSVAGSTPAWRPAR